LCRVSASRPIEPLIATMTICSTAVAPMPARLTHAALIPSRLDSSALWIASVWSWLCGVSACRTLPQNPWPWSWS
jgi:hypothetical protein